MTYQKLRVKWSGMESAIYYVNQVSAGFIKNPARYWLQSFSGTYTFDCKTRNVTLDDGVVVKDVDAEWEIV